jgi:hypothetical protein
MLVRRIARLHGQKLAHRIAAYLPGRHAEKCHAAEVPRSHVAGVTCRGRLPPEHALVDGAACVLEKCEE